MHQKRGRRSLINSRVLTAVRSPSSSLRGLRVRGPDHVKVAGREHEHGLPAAHVGADGGLRSRLTTSQPSSAKARPTDPVPENSSSNRGTLVSQVRLEGQPDHRSE